MAYQIGDKTYTDHPMLDEIVYNCKKILRSIVIKNDVYALDCETTNSITYADAYYILKKNGYISFELFPFNEEVLSGFGYPPSDVRAFLSDKYRIPVADREALTDYANDWFIHMYLDANGNPIGEENNYYRMLYGLPPYNTGKEFYISIDIADIPESAPVIQNPDGNYYLHEQPKSTLTILYSTGYIESLREQYQGSNYAYVDHLGNKSIDTLVARKAAKWDILYMPNVYYLVEDKFIEFYKINREMYANRSYQEYFAQIGDYYDDLMILCVLSETFSNLVTDVPEWYIRRDVFDLRSCKYFLESYGVEYYKEIPLKYQIKIVKNLNNLIKYKSTTKNFKDIIDIFNSTDNTKVYKYWLHKKRQLVDGEYSDTGDNLTDYEMQFISSAVDESYDSYIRDSRYRIPYDSLTLYDEYWDADKDHVDIEKAHLNKDFLIEGTKYMTIDQNIPLEDYLHEMEYFLGMLLSYDLGTEQLKIPVPSIDESALFKVSDLFIMLQLMTATYYADRGDDSDLLRWMYNESTEDYPYGFNIEDFEPPYIKYRPWKSLYEVSYDWKKKYIPEAYRLKVGRVFGFNPDVDIEELCKTVKKRHSKYRFGQGDAGEDPIKDDATYDALAEQWVDELKIRDFIVPDVGVHSIEEIVDIYENNNEIYETVREAIYKAENQDEKKILEYVYQELFTKKFDRKFYRLSDRTYATHLEEVLKDRDYILWFTYDQLFNESSKESRQDNVRLIMDQIIDTLEYYFQGTGLDYIFAFTTTESFSAILKYIYLMIKFFKSYKVHFVDPYTTFTSSDKYMENSTKAIDNIGECSYEYKKPDKSFSRDLLGGFNIEMSADDYGFLTTNQEEDADIYQYYCPDPLSDLDYNGLNAQQGEQSGYKELDGGTASTGDKVAYENINCGNAYLGLLDYSDLNGGQANEYNREYFEIDGGEAYHPEDRRTDYMGSTGFNYMIDGGGASNTNFANNTIAIDVIGTSIIGRVIVSPRSDNYITIEINDDGKFNFGNVGGYIYTPWWIRAFESDGTLYFIEVLANGALSYHTEPQARIGYIEPEAAKADGNYEFGCVGGDLYNPNWKVVLNADGSIRGFMDETGIMRSIAEATIGHAEPVTTTLDEDYDFDILATLNSEYIEDEDLYYGLYMNEENFVEYAELESVRNDVVALNERVSTEAAQDELIIQLLSDEDTRIRTFNEWTDRILYPFNYVLEQMADNTFENRLKSSIDTMCLAMKNSFSEEDLDPFLWQDL